MTDIPHVTAAPLAVSEHGVTYTIDCNQCGPLALYTTTDPDAPYLRNYCVAHLAIHGPIDHQNYTPRTR